jgi:hypothetical protein
MFVTGVLALLGSLPFILRYHHYMNEHFASYIDEGLRGYIQVKSWPHYVKYGVLSAGWFAFLWCLLPKASKDHAQTNPIEPTDTRFSCHFLLCLVAASLVGHFYTAKNGITHAGVGYFFIHTIAPFSMLAFFHLIWVRGKERYASLFNSHLWTVGILVVIIWQGLDLGLTIRKERPQAAIPPSRLILYESLSSHTDFNEVIISPLPSTEIVEFTGQYAFLPSEITDSYICSLPTSELLERFLLYKLLFTGKISDLSEMFQPTGISNIEQWVGTLNADQVYWLEYLKQNIGQNSFKLHPVKNKGEIRLKKLVLPEPLASEDHFVIYFDEPMRRIYREYAELSEPVSASKAIELIRQRYKVDYILLPRPNPILDQRLGMDKNFRLLTDPSRSERLWFINPDL